MSLILSDTFKILWHRLHIQQRALTFIKWTESQNHMQYILFTTENVFLTVIHCNHSVNFQSIKCWLLENNESTKCLNINFFFHLFIESTLFWETPLFSPSPPKILLLSKSKNIQQAILGARTYKSHGTSLETRFTKTMIFNILPHGMLTSLVFL